MKAGLLLPALKMQRRILKLTCKNVGRFLAHDRASYVLLTGFSAVSFRLMFIIIIYMPP